MNSDFHKSLTLGNCFVLTNPIQHKQLLQLLFGTNQRKERGHSPPFLRYDFILN